MSYWGIDMCGQDELTLGTLVIEASSCKTNLGPYKSQQLAGPS